MSASIGRAIVVIGGGANTEHDVSLASAASVASALRRAGHRVTSLVIDTSGRWCDHDGVWLAGGLADAVRLIVAADVVVPMIHGVDGEDGTLAALLNLCDVPYVGSDVIAGAIGMDKAMSKLVASSVGVAVARGVTLGPAEVVSLRDDTCSASRRRASADGALDGLRFPVVVKPTTGGSSVGVAVVRSADQLADALAAAAVAGGQVMVEEFINGREVDIAVLRLANGSLLVSPPLEIVVDRGAIFDTTTKYDGNADFRVPAALPPTVADDLDIAARAIVTAMGCSGVVRVDFFVTKKGLVFNEINTTPGMTEQSQVPRMFGHRGLDYEHLLELCLETAIARHELGRGNPPPEPAREPAREPAPPSDGHPAPAEPLDPAVPLSTEPMMGAQR